MVKRFISFLLLISLFCGSLVQAKSASVKLSLGSYLHTPSQIHPLFVVAAVNAFCFAAYRDLYKQKSKELSEERLKRSSAIENEREQEKWFRTMPTAHINGFDKSIVEIKNSKYGLEEKKSLMTLLMNLRYLLERHFEFYNYNEGLRPQESLRASFDKLLNQELLTIQLHIASKTTLPDRKTILEKRKASFQAAQKFASTFDSYAKNIKSPIDTENLKKKIAAKAQERDSLWVVPVALNGLMAMAYGLSYFFSSK